MRRSIDRRDVEQLELAGLVQFLSHLIAVRISRSCSSACVPRISPCEAGVDHLEIEHGELGRLGARARGANSQHQHRDNKRSHDRDLRTRGDVTTKSRLASQDNSVLFQDQTVLHCGQGGTAREDA